ncbi:NAD-dependent epimerase/dehydratase family protein [Variovorax sp. dw_308]|uniref:NAD-dependent epimerase/dehydratase family protein n=1 Tax=Variovorax sp. dw_308 TaxID=2721546 RepID=UPI001C460BF4|nr:NAD-dependent epimerase/dehydratase family protein [Variovorax sp. dw_308]
MAHEVAGWDWQLSRAERIHRSELVRQLFNQHAAKTLADSRQPRRNDPSGIHWMGTDRHITVTEWQTKAAEIGARLPRSPGRLCLCGSRTRRSVLLRQRAGHDPSPRNALVQLTRPSAMTLLVISANVYGNCAQSPDPVSQPLAPDNHYATSKMAMKYMARSYMDRLRLVIARTFNYMGAGQREDS